MGTDRSVNRISEREATLSRDGLGFVLVLVLVLVEEIEELYEADRLMILVRELAALRGSSSGCFGSSRDCPRRSRGRGGEVGVVMVILGAGFW